MYAVGSHVAGYLPDAEPWTTDNFASAVEMMVEDIERGIDEGWEDLSSSTVAAAEEQIRQVRAFAALVTSDPGEPLVVALTVGGRRHYVEEIA